jgi:hypothetical protein
VSNHIEEINVIFQNCLWCCDNRYLYVAIISTLGSANQSLVIKTYYRKTWAKSWCFSTCLNCIIIEVFVIDLLQKFDQNTALAFLVSERFSFSLEFVFKQPWCQFISI